VATILISTSKSRGTQHRTSPLLKNVGGACPLQSTHGSMSGLMTRCYVGIAACPFCQTSLASIVMYCQRKDRVDV